MSLGHQKKTSTQGFPAVFVFRSSGFADLGACVGGSCDLRFCIRGGFKLRAVRALDLALLVVSDEHGEQLVT